MESCPMVVATLDAFLEALAWAAWRAGCVVFFFISPTTLPFGVFPRHLLNITLPPLSRGGR